MTLPTFKITMLGGSGAGKTVYMASMYTMLSAGLPGIALRAVDGNVDLELTGYMDKIFGESKFPPGTDIDQKQYLFELLVNGGPVLNVDWIDYRGRVLQEGSDVPAAKELLDRLRESHAILWMIDMSRLPAGQALDNIHSRLITKVQRMVALCRQAMVDNQQPKAWIFVRTKSDLVYGSDGRPDVARAAQELEMHLGTLTDIAKRESGPYSKAAIIPISSVGRIENNRCIGDNPTLVEWPLLVSLAFVLNAEAEKYKLIQTDLAAKMSTAPDGVAQKLRKLFFTLESDEYQRIAAARLPEVTRTILKHQSDLKAILAQCPSVVRRIH